MFSTVAVVCPDADVPTLIELCEPRSLTADERALLDALAAPLAVTALDEQVASARVVAVCSCGCPSIGLKTEGPDLPESVGNLEASGANDEGREVEVILHVGFGRLLELEIWAGTWGGEVRTSLPPAASLRRSE